MFSVHLTETINAVMDLKYYICATHDLKSYHLHYFLTRTVYHCFRV